MEEGEGLVSRLSGSCVLVAYLFQSRFCDRVWLSPRMRLSSHDHSPLIARTRVLAIHVQHFVDIVSAPAPFLLLCGGGEERVWGMAGMMARA